MRQDENYLLTNLEDAFFRTSSFQRGDRLRAEMDVWLTEKQMRRPAVSYFTEVQLRAMAPDNNLVPAFVVEFGSESDSEEHSQAA